MYHIVHKNGELWISQILSTGFGMLPKLESYGVFPQSFELIQAFLSISEMKGIPKNHTCLHHFLLMRFVFDLRPFANVFDMSMFTLWELQTSRRWHWYSKL